MNAYELAKELEACFTKADWEYVDDCVNMLRQQADRIADLEKQLNLHKNAHHRAVEILQEKEKDYFNAGLDLHRQADRIADLETAVTFLRKALDDTLDALSSSIEFTKAVQERSRNERGL